MQVIGRIESVSDDIQIKHNKDGEITSARGTLTTFKPTGVFDFAVDKQFIQAGLLNELTKMEGQKLLFSFARVDLDLPDGGRYRAWSMRILPESLDSVFDSKKPASFNNSVSPSNSTVPAPAPSVEKVKL